MEDQVPGSDVVRQEGVVRVFGWYGDESLSAPAAEFAQEFYTAVGALGFEVEPDPFDDDLLPFGEAGAHAARHTVPDKGVTDQDPVALTVVVFVAMEMAKWAVGKVAESVWGKVAPAFGRLRDAVARRPRAAQEPPSRFVVRTVYGADQVVVELSIDLEGVDPEHLGRYLTEAQRQAVDAAAAAGNSGVRMIRFEVTAAGLSGTPAPPVADPAP